MDDRSPTAAGGEAVSLIDQVVRYTSGSHEVVSDVVAREEPLEIRLAGFQVAVTMRTPGHDFDLVTGFLITEGILGSADEIETMVHCEDESRLQNIVNVNIADPTSFDPTRFRRNLFASSSCGICGKASIDLVRQEARPLSTAPRLDPTVLHSLREQLDSQQPVFDVTGGLHAAGIGGPTGTLRVVREDIGRHNAVDKSVGALLRANDGGLSTSVLLVSGRASFEVVQKALMAGIPAIASVSAPSSLAVELAREAGMILVGFLRPNRLTVYAAPDIQQV